MASAFTYMTQLWILPLLAVSSIMHALYAVSVRRPAILPPASSRPCLTATPLLLASDLELPFRAVLAVDFHHQVNAHAGQTSEQGAFCGLPAVYVHVPEETGSGRMKKNLATPYSPTDEPQYHRRRGVSLSCSGWERVGATSLWSPGRPTGNGGSTSTSIGPVPGTGTAIWSSLTAY